eukprot:gene28740-35670_t
MGKAVTLDELLPLMIFTLVQAQPRHLATELDYIEMFHSRDMKASKSLGAGASRECCQEELGVPPEFCCDMTEAAARLANITGCTCPLEKLNCIK